MDRRCDSLSAAGRVCASEAASAFSLAGEPSIATRIFSNMAHLSGRLKTPLPRPPPRSGEGGRPRLLPLSAPGRGRGEGLVDSLSGFLGRGLGGGATGHGAV